MRKGVLADVRGRCWWRRGPGEGLRERVAVSMSMSVVRPRTYRARITNSAHRPLHPPPLSNSNSSLSPTLIRTLLLLIALRNSSNTTAHSKLFPPLHLPPQRPVPIAREIVVRVRGREPGEIRKVEVGFEFGFGGVGVWCGSGRGGEGREHECYRRMRAHVYRSKIGYIRERKTSRENGDVTFEIQRQRVSQQTQRRKIDESLRMHLRINMFKHTMIPRILCPHRPHFLLFLPSPTSKPHTRNRVSLLAVGREERDEAVAGSEG